jgi:Ulp1 family protease
MMKLVSSKVHQPAVKAFNDLDETVQNMLFIALRPLPSSGTKRSKTTFRNTQLKEVVAKIGTWEVTRRDLRTLRCFTWLNDSAINARLLVLEDQVLKLSRRSDEQKKVHLFNTYFMSKLMNDHNNIYTYTNVRTWTK